MFPPLLSISKPVRHHIVVYFLAQAKEDHQTLQGRLNLQHNEVDASTWLDEPTAVEVASSDDFGQTRKVPQRYFRSVARNRSLSIKILANSRVNRV